MISCRNAVEQMHEILDEEVTKLSEATEATLPTALDDHLASCTECRNTWDELSRAERELAASVRAPRAELSTGFHSQLMARLREQPKYGGRKDAERLGGYGNRKDKAQASLRTPKWMSLRGGALRAFKGFAVAAAIFLPGVLLFLFLREESAKGPVSDYRISAPSNDSTPAPLQGNVVANLPVLTGNLNLPAGKQFVAASGAGQVVSIGKSLVRNTSEAVESFIGSPPVSPQM